MSATLSNAPIGTYSIAFGAVTGYMTPAAPAAQTLASGRTVAFTGTYTSTVATGTITVNTNTPNATFNLSGPTNLSGSGTSKTFPNVPPRSYTVTYGPSCRSDLPATATMTVTGGGTTTVTGTFKPGFLSTFPVSGLTPCNIQINTVFDHSQTKTTATARGAYTNDNTVVAYTGESGSCVAGSAVQNYQSPVGVLHPHSGFRNMNGSVFTITGHGNYLGGGGSSKTVTCNNGTAPQSSLPSNALLFYDGHPGYDYNASCGTNVYAAAREPFRYPSTIPGVQAGGGATFHILELDPDSPNTAYKLYYLHLSTYPSVSGSSVSCMNAGPIVKDGTQVKAGQLIGKTGDAGVKGAPHFHFEVQKSSIPVDLYGWKGTGTDPYILQTNINLWQ